MGEFGFGQAGPGEGQHGAARIDANAVVNPGGQTFQQAPGAGADVQQTAGPVTHGIQHRMLDGIHRQGEGMRLVPIGAPLAEAVGGDPGAFGQHPGGMAAVCL